MTTRTDNIECEYCGRKLNGESYECTHTKSDHDFCSYECAEGYFGTENWLNGDDEFLINA